jgi:hypothetical protein
VDGASRRGRLTDLDSGAGEAFLEEGRSLRAYPTLGVTGLRVAGAILLLLSLIGVWGEAGALTGRVVFRARAGVSGPVPFGHRPRPHYATGGARLGRRMTYIVNAAPAVEGSAPLHDSR